VIAALLFLASAGAARAEWTADFTRDAARAQAALRDGRREAAAASIAALKVPESAKPADRSDMLLRRAELKAQLGDFGGVEADEREALSGEPRNFAALCALTQFLRERGRLGDSLKTAQALVQVEDGIPAGNRAEKWLQRAETLMRLGRFDESVADVERALRDKPGDVPSLWLMAQVLVRAGRAREAVAFADRMLDAARTPPEKARALSQRAQAREAAGDQAGADADVAQALAADPADHVALEARVQRLRAQGRLAEALEMSDRMVAAGSAAPPTRRAVLLEQRAQVKRALGDAAGAEADLAAALDAEPDSIPPLRSLAELRLERGDAVGAEEAAARLLKAAAEAPAPMRAEALLLRARAAQARGRRAEADADRGAALALAPDSAAVLRAAAAAALAAGDVAGALAASDRLVAVTAGATAQERSEARQKRAAALLAAGRRAEAGAEFAESARLTPGAAFPREQLAALALEDKRYAEAEALAGPLIDGAASARERAAALVLRARVRSARADRRGAGDDLKAALAADPSSREALAALVELDSRRSSSDEIRPYAERQFAAAAAAPAGDVDALQTMISVASLLTRVGRADLALADAKVLVERSASAAPALRAAALCARGTAFESLGRLDDALADADLAVAAAPAERAPRFLRARVLARLDRAREALAAADELVAVSTGGAPDAAAEALLWRAERRAAGGDWNGADADHRAAEAAAPGAHAADAAAGERWAAAVAALRGRKAAWELLSELRKAPGASRAARAALASAEAESRWSAGDAEGARAAMRAALDADAAEACAAPLLADRAKAAAAWFDACAARRPRDARLLNDRGVARWSAGRRREAEADFRAALAAEPGFLAAALSLASALEADGKAAEAARALETALSAPGADPALAGEARAQLARLRGR
jgi:Tfp pilus assembly protein PilF